MRKKDSITDSPTDKSARFDETTQRYREFMLSDEFITRLRKLMNR